MGKDELGIILETYADIRHQWIQSNAIKKEDVDKALAKAKSAILSWVRKQVPEKNYIVQNGIKMGNCGWNEAVDEMRRRFE